MMETNQILDELSRRFPAADLDRVEASLRYASGEWTPEYPHPLQEPSRLFFPGLSARAWYEAEEFSWIPDIESAAGAVRGELDALLGEQAGFYPYEDPYTLELGWRGWDTYSLYRKGRQHKKNCARCPATLRAIEKTPAGLRQGMFTKLHPGAHITPHTGGINVVLTCHLGLVIPPDCAIRVGDETRTWTPGKCLVFDDSFVHEAWNRGPSTRMILLWDIWHPDLTAVEIAALKYLFPIFDKAMRGRGGA